MKFIWKIENFSHLKCENLQSPSFSTQSTMWQLIIHQFEDIIEVELQQLGTLDIALNCSFALLDNEGSPFVWKDTKLLPYRDHYGFERYVGQKAPGVSVVLIKRHKIFGPRKTEFLPNDVLTLHCHMWKTVDDIPTVSILARSRVESAKVVKKFNWDIHETVLFQEGNIFEHAEPIMNEEFLKINLFFNTDNNFQVESKVSMFRCKMEIKILLLDAVKMKKIQFSNDEYNFTKKGEVWTFGTGISRNMILFHPNLYLPNNTLTLHFICSFSENVTFNRIVDENEILTISRPIAATNQISEASVSSDLQVNQPTETHLSNTISQALQEVLKEGLLSDFNLRTGGRLFPVHKVILSARSQVFRAMFETQMKEKEDNCVDIPDVDADTLQRLLQFVYADKFEEDMGWERASSLYAAADKYALESLKQRCSTILQSEFCISNVLKLLAMADMHNDQDLKSAALDFISSNDKEVVGAERWIEFEEENAKLALDTFRKLYVKKMND